MSSYRKRKLIDKKISKMQDNIVIAKKRYQKLIKELEKLQKEKDLIIAECLLKEFKKSKRSLDEVINFLRT